MFLSLQLLKVMIHFHSSYDLSVHVIMRILHDESNMKDAPLLTNKIVTDQDEGNLKSNE